MSWRVALVSRGREAGCLVVCRLGCLGGRSQVLPRGKPGPACKPATLGPATHPGQAPRKACPSVPSAYCTPASFWVTVTCIVLTDPLVSRSKHLSGP